MKVPGRCTPKLCHPEVPRRRVLCVFVCTSVTANVIFLSSKCLALDFCDFHLDIITSLDCNSYHLFTLMRWLG